MKKTVKIELDEDDIKNLISEKFGVKKEDITEDITFECQSEDSDGVYDTPAWVIFTAEKEIDGDDI